MYVHPRWMYVHPRQMHVHPRWMYVHPRQMYVHPRWMYVHLRQMYVHPRWMYVHLRQMHVHPRWMYARKERGGGVAGRNGEGIRGNYALFAVKRLIAGRECRVFGALAAFDGGYGPDAALRGREKKLAEFAEGSGLVF
ncbi:MAG: hypothetical protein LBL31_03370 [Spirochaetaceae bacterium]|nr:hypothetical protein [Spirochaetaceae bacterium]